MWIVGRAETVQSQEENAQSGLSHVYKLLMGGTEPGS